MADDDYYRGAPKELWLNAAKTHRLAVEFYAAQMGFSEYVNKSEQGGKTVLPDDPSLAFFVETSREAQDALLNHISGCIGDAVPPFELEL